MSQKTTKTLIATTTIATISPQPTTIATTSTTTNTTEAATLPTKTTLTTTATPTSTWSLHRYCSADKTPSNLHQIFARLQSM